MNLRSGPRDSTVPTRKLNLLPCQPWRERPDWRIVTDSRDKLGEGVLWNASTGDLFWVDFYGPTLHRLSSDGKRRDWSFPQFSNVGSLAFCEDGRLLLAFDRGLFLFDPRNSALAEFSDPNQQRTAIGYNDGKADRSGHLWIGTFDVAETAPRAILYRLTPMVDGRSAIAASSFAMAPRSPLAAMCFISTTRSTARHWRMISTLPVAAYRADAFSIPSLATTGCRMGCVSI